MQVGQGCVPLKILVSASLSNVLAVSVTETDELTAGEDGRVVGCWRKDIVSPGWLKLFENKIDSHDIHSLLGLNEVLKRDPKRGC